MRKIIYDNLFHRLKEKNITTYYLRKNNIVGESTIQKIRDGKSVNLDILCRISDLLDCEPADLFEYVKK